MILDTLRRWFGSGGSGGNGSRGKGPGGVSCEEALARIYEYMDGELDHLSQEAVAEHFRVCTRCYPHLKLERSFRSRVQEALSRPEVPGSLRNRVLGLLGRQGDGD